MSLPTYDQFIEPVLRYLATQRDGVAAREAYEAAADALQLTEDQRSVILTGGQAVYKNRAGWAHDRLKRAGLSQSLSRGNWCLTAAGRDLVATHPQPFSEAEINHLAFDYTGVKLKPSPEAIDLDCARAIPSEDELVKSSPDDRLDQAMTELREAVANELLENLLQVTPGRFEAIVLDVLHRLGYGGHRDDLQRVGGSGDGGIDGIISLDKLGLEKVYVQAKRWQGTVGRPELQAFYGALAGQKARRGVFITTSGFTAHALEFSRSVEGMVLVDGKRLVHLMMDHEIGVASRLLRVPKLDMDYFE